VRTIRAALGTGGNVANNVGAGNFDDDLERLVVARYKVGGAD
jgi:hypothetical protein